MAKNSTTVKSAAQQTREDNELLKTIESTYKTVGFSPKSKIEIILRNSHEYFRELVRALVQKLLSQQDTSILDRVITHPTIKPTDGWVPNVARLSERCIAEQIADELLATTTVLTTEDLKAEVLGKLRDLMEARDARQSGYRSYDAAVSAALAAGTHMSRIPAAIPHPAGLIPPSEAFPLTRLQPLRGKTTATTPTWKP
jgi:hypothetical protein